MTSFIKQFRYALVRTPVYLIVWNKGDGGRMANTKAFKKLTSAWDHRIGSIDTFLLANPEQD